MLKNILILPLVLLSALPAAAQAIPSEENQYTINMFTQLNTALAFDDDCNRAKAINDEKGSLYGNIEMVADRTFAAIRAMNPAASDDDINKLLQTNGKDIVGKAKTFLKEKGCKSEDGKKLESVLTFFADTPPAEVSKIMDGEIRKLKTVPKTTAQ